MKRARCRVCGKPVFLVRDYGPPVNLGNYRAHHVKRWRDLLHPPSVKASDFE